MVPIVAALVLNVTPPARVAQSNTQPQHRHQHGGRGTVYYHHGEWHRGAHTHEHPILRLDHPTFPRAVGRRGPDPREGGTPALNRMLGRAMAAALYGWTGREWAALDRRFSYESGWNHRAINPSSGAAGLPQRLPRAHPFRSDAARRAWMANPAAQILWGLAYVRGRYGRPTNIPYPGPY